MMNKNPEKVSDVLVHVEQLLDANRPQQAIELMRKFGLDALQVRNAYGVALMRAGDTDKALEVFRNLCVSQAGFCLKPGIPVTIQLNYATALLLAKNVAGCLTLLSDINLEQHPYVQKLRYAISGWMRALGWWKRLAFAWYRAESTTPVELDFPPGELYTTSELRPAA
jgi:hypothetical protein